MAARGTRTSAVRTTQTSVRTAPGARAVISEEAIQRAVFDHIRARGAPDAFAFHPRNGSKDQHALAGINAGLGVISGVPDVVVVMEGVPFALELKTESGKLSRDQARVLRELQAAGVDAGVAYGLDEAIRWLEDRAILRGRASKRVRA
jgi:hypothetical protein